MGVTRLLLTSNYGLKNGSSIYDWVNKFLKQVNASFLEVYLHWVCNLWKHVNRYWHPISKAIKNSSLQPLFIDVVYLE